MGAQHPIVIIGSGYAGLQLARQYRRHSPSGPLVIVSADDGAEYAKPQLSHVISKRQAANDLVSKQATELAKELKALFLTEQQALSIDAAKQIVQLSGRELPYRDLILAVGAEAWVPPVNGDATSEIITLNSLQEYRQHEVPLKRSHRVLIIGAGLIGCELANDFLQAGKHVTVCDPTDRVLSALLPEFASEKLQAVLSLKGCQFELLNTLVSAEKTDDGIKATFRDGKTLIVDCIVCAAGLRPRVTLAKTAGLNVNRGIIVNNQLMTSVPNIYALGDCTEMDGYLRPYLQPIMVSAQALAKTLSGEPSKVCWPVMPVNVKTTSLPVQSAGDVRSDDLIWQLDEDDNGLTGRAFRQEQLVGFVTAGQHTAASLNLLKQLNEN